MVDLQKLSVCYGDLT